MKRTVYDGAGAVANDEHGSPIILVDDAKVIKHLNIPIESASGGSAPIARVTETPYLSWTFSVNDDAHFTFNIPHDMDFTEDLTIAVEWYTSVDQTDDEVQWQIEWNAKAEGEAVNAGSTTDVSGDINCPTQWQRLTTLIETIPGGSIAADDTIGLDLTRIAIDDGTNPQVTTIHLLGMHIEYTTDKLGES